MSKMKAIKLNPCKACGVRARMVKIQLIDGNGNTAGHTRREWWHQVECKGFHHTLTIRHRDKESAGRLWNAFNNIEEFNT